MMNEIMFILCINNASTPITSVPLKNLCFVTLREDGGSVNFSDQKRVEFEVLKSLGFEVSSFRAPLLSFGHCTMGQDGRMMYKGKEVAMFYLRSGYDPSCYPVEKCWAARQEQCLKYFYYLIRHKGNLA